MLILSFMLLALPLQTAQAGILQATAAPSFVVPRPGPILKLPRAETLIYEVHIRLGPIASNAGTVTQRSRIEPFRTSLLSSDGGGKEVGLESAHMTIHAKGGYQVYKIDTVIETRILPQEWPQVTHRTTNRGTEKRRRETKYGARDGIPTASYRGDTKHGAPRGTRIWTDFHSRAIPADTVDMLSSIYLARTLIETDAKELSFPLIDKLWLWQLTLRRGIEKTMKIPAGTFDVVEVVIHPTPYPGEKIGEKKKKRFKGLFGIHGDTKLWVDRKTGVPVRIQGDLPVGILTLGIDVRLKGYKGTPRDFQPRKEP
jgi:hypothetical protein